MVCARSSSSICKSVGLRGLRNDPRRPRGRCDGRGEGDCPRWSEERRLAGAADDAGDGGTAARPLMWASERKGIPKSFSPGLGSSGILALLLSLLPAALFLRGPGCGMFATEPNPSSSSAISRSSRSSASEAEADAEHVKDSSTSSPATATAAAASS